MSEYKRWQFELSEYICQSELDQIEKNGAWQTVIRLQDYDGLKTYTY